jgi:hypothetical protein
MTNLKALQALAALVLAACASPSVAPAVSSASSAASAPSPAAPTTSASPARASAPTAAGLELAIALAQACTTQLHRGVGPGGSRIDFTLGARVEPRDGGRVAITFGEQSGQASERRTLEIDPAQRTCDGAPLALAPSALVGTSLSAPELVALARACAERAPHGGRGLHGSPLVWDRAHLLKGKGEIGTTRWTVHFGEQTVATPSGLQLRVDTRDGSCTAIPQLD